MDVLADWNTQDSPFRLNQWRARRRTRQQEQRERQRLLWGGPVDADRVLAFSDAVFAIAITLLTLRLEVPSNLQGPALARELRDLLPAIGAYTLSFVILGRLWLTHHRIFAVVARVDRSVLVRNLTFLAFIAVMPFPVRLLSDYHDRPLAIGVYALTFIVAMLLQGWLWIYVTAPERRELLREPFPTRSARASPGRSPACCWSSARWCRW